MRKGQRRTLAAVRAQLQAVRVLIEADVDPSEADNAGQIERIIDQYGENTHGAGISEADEANAHQQLLELGLTAGQIARRTHTPTKRVRALTSVNRSEHARDALDRYELTIDQAATIAEFDDGTEDGGVAVQQLVETAAHEPAQFGHRAQRLRDERRERQMVAEHAQELSSQGTNVLSAEQIVDATELYQLRPTSADRSGAPLRPEAHVKCPGHAVYVTVRRGWGNQPPEIHTEYYCTDARGNGHAPRYNALPGKQPTTSEPLSEEQVEERRADRRRVIENNKAWDSATTHRRTWLAEFVARKKPPVNAAVFIAAALAGGSHDLRRAMESGHPTACALLGLAEPVRWTSGPRPLVETAATATGARATQISLAVLLGAYEDGTSRNSWRNPSSETVAYFAALRDWNYPLSPVEQLVLDTQAVQAQPEPDDDNAGSGNDNAGSGDDSTASDEDGMEEEPVEAEAEDSHPVA